MKKQFSIYLDLIRTIAAFTVAIFHFFQWPEFTAGQFLWFGYGQEAVIVFFVLSGFVIGYVAETKGY